MTRSTPRLGSIHQLQQPVLLFPVSGEAEEEMKKQQAPPNPRQAASPNKLSSNTLRNGLEGKTRSLRSPQPDSGDRVSRFHSMCVNNATVLESCPQIWAPVTIKLILV